MLTEGVSSVTARAVRGRFMAGRSALDEARTPFGPTRGCCYRICLVVFPRPMLHQIITDPCCNE